MPGLFDIKLFSGKGGLFSGKPNLFENAGISQAEQAQQPIYNFDDSTNQEFDDGTNVKAD